MILVSILFIYTAFVVFISFNQINFLKKEKNKKAIILEENEYKNSANIAIENEKFKIFSNIYSFFVNSCFIIFGFAFLKDIFIKDNDIFENTLFLLSFLVILSVLNLPLSYYETFVKDKKHGFTNTNLLLFVKDSLKSFILMIVFGFFILYTLIFMYKFLGNYWYLYAFLFSFLIIIIINLIYPTLIAPIFNKMEKLEDENLLKDIKSLMEKCGFSANGIYIMDASKRDNRLNAYFGGLFKSKKVVLFDTLLKALKKEELLAVLGHELGHFVHKDIFKLIFANGILLFLLFFVFANLPFFVYGQSGLSGVYSGVFAIILIFANVFSFIFYPVLNYLSRKNEFNADKFGAKMSSKEDMKNALFALAKANKAFVKSSMIYTFFYLTHPSIEQRLKALK